MENRIKELEEWRREMTAQLEAVRAEMKANTALTQQTNNSVNSILAIWKAAELGSSAFNWLVKIGCSIVVAWASWKALK